MPAAPGATPRNRLPPPITTAISSPSEATWAISPTMRESVAGLIPNASSPISASPLSLSSTRLNFSAAATSGCFFGLVFIFLGLAHLRHHLGGEIARLLLDALADHVEKEAGDRGLARLQQGVHRLLVVLDERLPEQRNFLEELLHAAFDHLRDDLRRFPRFGRLRRGDGAFLLHELRRNLVLRQALGLGCGDMHGEIAPELLVAAHDVYQRTDLRAAVHVLRQPPLRLDPGETPD